MKSLSEITSLLQEASELESKARDLKELKEMVSGGSWAQIAISADGWGVKHTFGPDTTLKVLELLEPLLNVDLKVKEVRDQLAMLEKGKAQTFRQMCPISTAEGEGAFNVVNDPVLGWTAKFPSYLRHKTDSFINPEDAWTYLESQYRLEEARAGTLPEGYYKVRQKGAETWAISFYSHRGFWEVTGVPDPQSYDHWDEIGDRIDL